MYSPQQFVRRRFLAVTALLAYVARSFYASFPMHLKEKVALVTGSGRGIGRAIAQVFAREGASVFLTARTEKELAATAAEITASGGHAAFAIDRKSVV